MFTELDRTWCIELKRKAIIGVLSRKIAKIIAGCALLALEMRQNL